MKRKRADFCEECIYHHKDENSEDGWYCGKYQKYSCNKSKILKDYSIKKEERKWNSKS